MREPGEAKLSHDGDRRRGAFPSGDFHAAEWAERDLSSRVLHRVGEYVAHAGSGIVAAVFVALWAMLGLFTGFPTWWQTALYSVVGSVTFVMVFVIQHTQQRQTAATQRKLDELLRATEQADSKLMALEEAPDAELEVLAREHVAEREHARDGNDDRSRAHDLL